MNAPAQHSTSGSYVASLLGTIRSHLEGLQGYDVMALELIQNADDAKADEISFNITVKGLWVSNSGVFSFCGDLSCHPCASQESDKYACDYHRITEVASGGKLSRGDNIGRFGIGFVSTYQITDHPEIHSAGIKLTLYPESGKWFCEPADRITGTQFFLPWADDPSTEGRRLLGVSHINASHIDRLTQDFLMVLRKSLLFLRHVRKAEVRRNGDLLLACHLDRSEGSKLKISFHPTGDVEDWHVLRTDAKSAAERLYEKHPRLEALERETKISISLRVSPTPLKDGYLYAFLPTEQLTGLPLHINADFFPEADRKNLIFTGHQHQQAWNEMLIDEAAIELARDLEGLLEKLGHIHLWQILSRALVLSTSNQHPSCFSKFWERLKTNGAKSQITLTQDGSVQCPNAVLMSEKPLKDAQVAALHEIRARLLTEDLRSYRNALSQLGATVLTLDRLTALMAPAFANETGGTSKVTEQRVEGFFRPLWSIVNDLLPENMPKGSSYNPSVQKLLTMPFVVTEDMYLVTINQSYVAPTPLDASSVASLLPKLAILSNRLHGHQKIAGLVKLLNLSTVVSHLSTQIQKVQNINDLIGTDKIQLRGLYSLLANLDWQGNSDRNVYLTLRKLPIWLSSKGLVKAEGALLPGNFNDPTGQAYLLDPSVLTDYARDFVANKLGIQSQTIEAFVLTVLPQFFTEHGPADPSKYERLLTELSNHTELLNDDKTRGLLTSLRLLPTQDGHWSAASSTYRYTEELAKVLGDAKHLWLDLTRIPNTRSVSIFVDGLGICRSPMAGHLVDRILFIAERFNPTADAVRASSEAFYLLCEYHERLKDKKDFQEAIARLRGTPCFPADANEDQWFSSSVLYAPFRAEAFKSQAHILSFKNTRRLNPDLLQKLGICVKAETSLIINHLLFCADNELQPNISTYQILNERVTEDNQLIASRLWNTRCIYVDSQKLFVRPNQLYWAPQQLGRFAFTIPSNLEPFRPLFNVIGVKNAPTYKDYIDFVLDIVGAYFEKGTVVVGPDHSVYDACLSGIGQAFASEELDTSELSRLQKAPSVLNLLNRPTFPDEVLLQDSQWHATFFNGELSNALCRPAPELYPLLEMVGVKRLSECAEVSLEYVDGPIEAEDHLAKRLRERVDIVARLLHDKPTLTQKKISEALATLIAYSHEVVRIQATVTLGDDSISAPPSSVVAFYDIDMRHLVLARPVTDRIWSQIFNALFHQLMPEESGSEISKLALSLSPLMMMSVEDAHRELTDAGIPFLFSTPEMQEDLTSPQLEEIGMSSAPEADPDPPMNGIPTELIAPSTPELTTLANGDDSTAEVISMGPIGRGTALGISSRGPSGDASNFGITSTGLQPPPEASPQTQTQNQSEDIRLPWQRNETGSSSSGRVTHESNGRKPRSTHKEQWDRRLLSYVRTREQVSGSEGYEDRYEHNLAVEVVARNAVCAYEKARGRIPVQMQQTHPGYDIVSQNPLTGEERIIEVKGVNGEWNKTGVGLSRLQFSNAQDLGDKYWLYVVEFALDPQFLRVHPLQSPATQVTAFMFDGKWREAVTEESADPAVAFIAGRKVKHQSFGVGYIESMDLRGNTRVMSIEFENLGRRTVSLNLQVMEVIEDEYGDYNS